MVFGLKKGQAVFYKITFEFLEVKGSKTVIHNSFKIELKRGNQKDYTEKYSIK